jgi:hypothetical protein
MTLVFHLQAPKWPISAHLGLIPRALRIRLQDPCPLIEFDRRPGSFGENDMKAGAGQITMVLRMFLESDVNRDALIEPILSAVSWVKDRAFAKHGLALLDVLDQIKLTELLATMRGLDVFSERSIGSYLSVAIRNKILKILESAKPRPEGQVATEATTLVDAHFRNRA